MPKTEITIKGTIIGVVLGVIFSAYTSYMSMKVGRVASMSIAIVTISMVILKCFKKHNELEHNMIQTVASAGETVTAGITFTIPAMIMLGQWQNFRYGDITTLIIAGSLLGIALTVPLRKMLIIKLNLPYPTGVAAATALQAMHKGNNENVKFLCSGGVLGCIAAIMQSVNLAAKNINMTIGSKILTIGLEPGVFAIGFLSGAETAIALSIGLAINTVYSGFSHDVTNLTDSIRMLAVGMMGIGSLVSAVTLLRFGAPAFRSLSRSKFSIKDNQDIPTSAIVTMVFTAFLLLMVILHSYLPFAALPAAAICCIFIAFICAVVCSYTSGMTGLVPLSGSAVISIICFTIFASLWPSHLEINGLVSATVICAAVSCITAVIGSDNMHDLKIGQIIGSAPWKQQVMLIAGSVAVAFFSGPILQMLLDAYGLSVIAPNPIVVSGAMPAPQATLIATFINSITGPQQIQWNTIALGGLLATLTTAISYILRKKSMPVFILALGVYLPSEATTTLIAGGCMRALLPNKNEDNMVSSASGIIAGSSILAIILTSTRVGGFDVGFTIQILMGLMIMFATCSILGATSRYGKMRS